MAPSKFLSIKASELLSPFVSSPAGNPPQPSDSSEHLLKPTLPTGHESEKETAPSPPVPAIVAIRGNDPPKVSTRSTFSTEITGLPTPVGALESRNYMLEYLARKFGPQDLPASFEDNAFRVGSLFDHIEARTDSPADTTLGPAYTPVPAELPRDGTPEELQPPTQKEQCAPETSESVAKTQATAGDVTLYSGQTALLPPEDEVITLAGVSQILSRLVRSSALFPYTTDEFLSDGRVWSFMTENRVRMILDQCELGVDDGEKADIAHTICGMPSSKTDIDFTSYRKVFTILILMEKHDQILHFIKEQLHDSLLPLQSIGDRDNIHHIGLPNSSVLHPCFQSWSIKSIKDFGTYQLKLSAPFFKDYGNECRHYFFPKNVALPFIPVRRKEFEGAFSSVTKVRLPKHHGNLRLHTQKRGKDQIFAIKRLFSTDRKPFQIEASVLGRLNSIGHEHNTKHIAKLLATFEVDSKRGPTFYFIFPCADHNLWEFWNTYTPHQDAAQSQRISNWMARQLNGLAHALQILHEFADFRAPSDKDPRRFGIHGDIKPQNILCFRNWNGEEDEFGFLQLADFGLAQYHKSVSVNRVSSRRTWHHYSPPESGLDWPTGRPLDIWALGCLFMEFTVWLNFGTPGLFDFGVERDAPSLVLHCLTTHTFYDCYSLPRWFFGECVEVSIAQSVLNWAMKVHDAPHTPKFIHDLVDLAVQDMLVPIEREQDKAGAISKMCERLYLRRLIGKPRLPTDRIVISDLVKKLDNMIERDAAYFEQPFKYDKSSFSWPPLIITRSSGAELNVRSRSEHPCFS